MKPKIVIGTLVIVAALGWLIIGGMGDTTVYYLTVSELRAQPSIEPEKGYRVTGYVDTTSIQWDAQTIKLGFCMFEETDSLQVIYHGIAPDQLRDAQQVVVEGKFNAEGHFQANKLLLKCPSKYEADNPLEQI